MNMMKKWAMFLVLFVVSSQLDASEAMLRSFLVDVTRLSANFVQRVEDENGSLLSLSTGKFYLSRPGRFRWDYQNADFAGELGQQIVADSKDLYFYDPDLEQVTQRSLLDAMGQVPSLLLVQSGADLDQHFMVTNLGLTDGLSWVALKPKTDDAGYRQLMIGFTDDSINTLLLYDGLGNSTKLEFTDVDTQADFADSMFDFVVPKGADLLSDS